MIFSDELEGVVQQIGTYNSKFGCTILSDLPICICVCVSPARLILASFR